MNPTILYVDDDRALLRSVERNLCLDFDLVTAESGRDALRLLAENGSIPVVMTDMKMPQMDGVRFIEEARMIAPDSIYMMLTGNQDVDTAIRAVNEGAVFRFLNKPCATEDIRKAIRAALRHHELVNAEKELLQKTFVGAVKVMTDLAEATRPELQHESQQVDQTMRACEEALGIKNYWEYRLAARLSLMGLALLSPEQQAYFRHVVPTEKDATKLLAAVSEATASLLDRIPRLGSLAQIIRGQCDVDGAVAEQLLEGADVAVGATLLRTAIHWTTMLNNGLSPQNALAELRAALPHLDTRIQKALLDLADVSPCELPRALSVDHLREGMVLHENVLSDDGVILLRSGRTLTTPIIKRLRLHSMGLSNLKSIVVIDSCAKHE